MTIQSKEQECSYTKTKTNGSTQFIFCKATKLKNGDIPNIFNKTLELVKNTLFKFSW